MIAQRAFAILLFAGILAMPLPQRWPYAVLQVALFTAACAAMIRTGGRRNAVVAIAAAAAVWGAVQIAAGTTVYARATLDKTLDWLTWLAAAYLGSVIYFDRAAAARFSRWLALFASLVAAGGLVIRYVFRIPYMGPFVYENQYAAFVELALPPAVLASFHGQNRLAWTAAAALMTGSVIVSGSVAGAGLVIVETAVVFLLLRTELRLPWKRLGAAMAGLAILVVTVGAITGWEALQSDLERQQPFELRRQLTKATLEMAAQRPLFGFGLGTWSTVYPAFAAFDDGVFDNQAHNDWAQWLAEGGLPLFGLMLGLTVTIALPAVGSRWGIGLLFVLAHCLLEYHFQQRPAFGCLFFALAGAVCGSSRQSGTSGRAAALE
jgi:O-antigen ligase